MLPGPLCTLVLADMGADVLKVEDPYLGDYLRGIPPMVGPSQSVGARFAALNRGKRSLALDLKRADAREAFLRLVQRAQMVVETFRPGVLDRLGIGFDVLRARNPKIVLCSITGYGQTGPYRDRAGHDLNYGATAGMLSQSGHAGGPPEPAGVQVADCAGALWGVIGILAALRLGTAQHVDISMTEAAMSFMIPMLGVALNGFAPPDRGCDRLTGGVAAYDVYATRDGHVALGALEPKFWQAFCSVIGRVAHVGHDFVAPGSAQAAMRAEVATVMSTRTTAEWMAAFEGKEVCCDPVLELANVASHPLHEARENVFEMNGVRYPRTPLGPPSAMRPAPNLGEHSAQVLREAGFSDDEITTLTH